MPIIQQQYILNIYTFFFSTIMPESNDIAKGLLLKKVIELHEFHVQTNHADAWF